MDNQQLKGEKKKMLSKEEVIKELFLNFPEEKEQIEILDFQGKSKESIFKCKKCNNTFKISAANLLKRRSKKFCLFCNDPLKTRKAQKNLEEKAISLFEKTPNLHLIELFQKQRGNRRRLAVRYYCDICGEESEIYFTDLKNDYYSCKWCQKGSYKSKEQFEKWLNVQYNEKFSLIDSKEIITAKDRIHIKCNDCGFIFYPSVTSLRRTRKIMCPKCRKGHSRGELFINDWLAKQQIDFIPEKNFDWLPNSHMRYDFVIPKNFLIIEYDGRQHMEWEPHFGSYEKFLHLQENDRIKDKLAIQKGYNLLRIPFYYESELRNILENLFSSTTISKESRGKLLEIDSFLNNKEEDIV